MKESFIEWVESLTTEKVIFCLVVIVLAAFSLGFQIGMEQTEAAFCQPKKILIEPTDAYKRDLIQSDELQGAGRI